MPGNLDLLDGRKVERSLRVLFLGDGSLIPFHVMTDASGAPISADNPLQTVLKPAGSTGIDFSANAPDPGGEALLIEIPASLGRAKVEIQNQSADLLRIVRDDGTGNNVTVLLLAGSGAGQPGQSYSSTTFRGRLRVYGPAAAQVAAYQD